MYAHSLVENLGSLGTSDSLIVESNKKGNKEKKYIVLTCGLLLWIKGAKRPQKTKELYKILCINVNIKRIENSIGID